MTVKVLDGRNFTETLAQNELVVVDFWAQWCAPCRAFSKVVAVLSEEYPAVLFASVNIEAEPELSADFNIQSVPAVMIVKQQVVVYAESGALTHAAMVDLIERAVALDVSDDERAE